MASKKKVSTDVDELLNDALTLISSELEKFKSNNTSDLLDRNATISLNEYTRTIISYKKEKRLHSVEDEIAKLEDKNLDELAKQALEYLKKNK